LADRYAIERVLGRGGMATVYLATDLRHPRSVAVKVLRPGPAVPLGGARFVREIRITAGLVHPHILPLYDSGEAGGILYYVMPYVAGETLREHLTRAGRFTLDEALRIGCEVADALAYAHAHGIVHRDIKPENILLSDGHAVVADFGIGHVAGDTLTGSGFAVGTVAYMSPEQAAGDRSLDGRADVYSLGCVLYEMLTGRLPFRREASHDGTAAHEVAPRPSMRVLRGDVPAAVDEAVAVALARDPAQRFATAREFGDALARAQGTSSRAVPVAAPGRRPAVAFGAALAAVVAALLVRGVAPPTAPLITVAPFHVAAAEPGLQRWGVDLPLVLARRLDAAEPLRASTPAGDVERQPEVTDRTAAVALGHRTGARYVVMGGVLRTTPSAVRVETEVVDVVLETVVDEVQTTTTSPVLDVALQAVSDSLTRGLLASFGASVRVAATRHAAFGCASSSWPAVTSYLRGEQYFRRMQWDSAITAYEAAVALDSGCALAYHRVAVALGWRGTGDDSIVDTYHALAGAHNHGLPPRDSLLVLTDSLTAAVDAASRAPHVAASAYWGYVRRLVTTAQQAAHDYPGDAEAAYVLADAGYHFGRGPASTTTTDILTTFDVAIRQDSGFALSYPHPIELAYVDGGRDRTMRYLRAYVALQPSGVEAEGARLLTAITDPRTAHAPDTMRRLAGDTLDVLAAARNMADRWADSAEVAVRLSRVIAQRRGTDTVLVHRCAGGFAPAPALATRLAYRGHLREALCALGDSAGRPGSGGRVFAELVSFGAVPDRVAAGVFDDWLRTGATLRNYALPWWVAHRDTAHLGAFRHRADSVLRAPTTDGAGREWARYDTAAAGAYRTLLRGDSAAALARFAALPRTWCKGCFDFDRQVEAELRAASGDAAGAERILREWRGEAVRPHDIRIRFARARLAERRRDVPEAALNYRAVVDTWRHADPVLQPYVVAAERALARLGAT
ncbi:MAG TPA: serine/threonine-protein kinase, partial [Gemmatirosa sp.]